MAKARKWHAVDVSDVDYLAPEFAALGQFLMQAFRNVEDDYIVPNSPGPPGGLKVFALRHGLLYQTLRSTVLGRYVPKNDFLIAVGEALRFSKDGVFVLLLLGAQAKTPPPYRKLYDPLIQEQAVKAGLSDLLG